MRRAPLAIVLVLISLSCAWSTGPGEEFAQAYFSDLQAGEYGPASDRFAEIFLDEQGVSRAQVASLLANTQRKLGTLQSCKLEHSKVISRAAFKKGRSGYYYYLVYECQYERYRATQYLAVFDQSGDRGLEIVDFDLRSIGLLAD